MDQIYNQEFYLDERESSSLSALSVIDQVLTYLRPESVVDVGCGVGSFLKVFKDKGITTILGIDGPWVDRNSLLIQKDEYISQDLSQRFRLNRRFDLVISLETAEHISSESAYIFIDNLTNLGDVILFSAAIPFQGGEHHVNLQWPEYWYRLFSKRGFVYVDCIRDKLWNNPNVSYYYAQNSIFYVKRDSLLRYPLLNAKVKDEPLAPLSLVHPKRYLAEIMVLETYRKYIPAFLRKILYNKLINRK